MSDAAARSPRRKRKWRWLLRAVAALALVGGLIALANGFFATRWGAGWLGRRISSRLGLETELQRASWTPWSGGCVEGLRIYPPSEEGTAKSSGRRPLLKIAAVQAEIGWKTLWRKKGQISAVHVREPEVELSLQTLRLLARSHLAEAVPAILPVPPPAGEGEPPISSSPALAGGPDPNPAANPSDTAPPGPSVPAPALAAGETAGAPGAAPTPAPAPAIPSPPEDRRPPLQLTVSGGSFRLIHEAEGTSPLWEVEGLAADFRVQGPPAVGRVEFSALRAGGRMLSGPQAVQAHWESPQLRLGPEKLMLAGLETEFGMLLGRLPGLPFIVEMAASAQPFPGFAEDSTPASAKGPVVTAERLQFGMRALGRLTAPGSWDAGLQVETGGVQVRREGELQSFERGQLQVLIRSGILSCPDLRLIGERGSLLGNGLLLADGRGAAVVRLVLPPEEAGGVAARFGREQQGLSPHFMEMGTRDRVMLDLRWVSYQGSIGIQLGEEGPVTSPDLVRRALLSPWRTLPVPMQ